MVDNITPPTPAQVLDQKMYGQFKSLHPSLSHNPSQNAPDPVWGFNSDAEAQSFVEFFRDIWKLGEDRIAITKEDVGSSLEGISIGSTPQSVVRLNTNIGYVEGKVDNWARERGISDGRSCVKMRFRV